MPEQVQPYTVRHIHVVARGADVLVREYTLDPGQFIPWHHHTEVAEHYYGLENTVVVETRGPAGRHEIGVGQTATVTPPTAHRVSNPGSTPCRYLLVQGVGKHDFIKED